MAFSWKSLQNGSDIRGVALSGVPNENVNLSHEVAEIIGKSYSYWLKESKNCLNANPIIGVGIDSRLSGPDIKNALIKGLLFQGAKILDFGLATTPAMFMSTQFKQSNCDGAIMITASHLPPNRNGFKFFTRKSGLEKFEISRILDIAENNKFNRIDGGVTEGFDIISPYSQFIIDFIRNGTRQEQPLKDLKIIVDAGNGAGGFFVDNILKPLGANTSGSIYLEPDGNFPNHSPNPEDKIAINAIRNAVLNNKADLGIIFDTDVDRAAVVDKQGNPLNRNALIALLSSIILREHPNSYIVTDSVTSDGLTAFIESLGGIHHRFKRGYKNVINESINLNKQGKGSWLAIETSGHAAFQENFFLDDGAFLVAKVLIEVSRLSKEGHTISNLLTNLKHPAEEAEYRIKINDTDFKEYGNKVIESLKKFVELQNGWDAEEINYEGYRVNCKKDAGDGWFLLRLSLHDSVMPLNVESNSIGGVGLIIKSLRKFLDQFDILDTKALY